MTQLKFILKDRRSIECSGRFSEVIERLVYNVYNDVIMYNVCIYIYIYIYIYVIMLQF